MTSEKPLCDVCGKAGAESGLIANLHPRCAPRMTVDVMKARNRRRCIACGRLMPRFAVEHRTFGNVTVECHTACEPTEEQLWNA